jgi:hypothetical protein
VLRMSNRLSVLGSPVDARPLLHFPGGCVTVA